MRGRRGGSDGVLGVDRRKALYAVVAAVVLAAAVFTLIGQAAEFGELREAVAKADKAWLPLCLAGQLLAYAGYILAYRDFARVDGGPELPYWTVTRIVAVGFGAFVVGSAAGGLALYAALRAFSVGTQLVPAALVLAYATGYAATGLPLPAGGAEASRRRSRSASTSSACRSQRLSSRPSSTGSSPSGCRSRPPSRFSRK